ncbi:hypothetical protein [Halomonas ventosae]|uniref:Uncharacterized protein n=1 Tax=Halomonas ventosae TaxID=229007 RepID=A0A4R6I231_9GAMM|nr:hypothetical protein [Halomonas ventosae]TDO15316.1 hypothetical protein DFO68_102148 [Halomonas ventosae]
MLLASQAVTAEITDNEIRIGNLADMTGAHRDPIGPLGEDAIRMAIVDWSRRATPEPLDLPITTAQLVEMR